MKHLIKSIFLALLFSQNIFATIIAKLDRPVTIRGTENSLVITIYGDDIETPNISKIGGFKILGVSTENFYNNINGVITQGQKFHYSFMPDKNSTIEPLTFKVDGVYETTDEILILVVKPSFNSEDPFTVQISTDKNEYLIGETIKLKVKYKEKLPQDVVDRRYTEPSGDNLWLKAKSKVRESQNGTDYFIEITYLFTAQKVGKIDISSAKMKIGTRAKRRDSWGMFFESTKWHSIISNSIKLNILNSPTKFVGDFDISSTVDKNRVISGEAVNLFLTISGDGNLEDLESFGINMQSGVVYDEKPTLENSVTSDGYSGLFTQKFAIILDENITIPSFEIKYYDPNLKKIIVKKSKPIQIIVDNIDQKSVQTEKLNVIKSSDEVLGSNSQFQTFNIYLVSGVSFLGGVLFTLLFIYSPFKRFKIWKRLRDLANRDRESLKKLLPYMYKDKMILDIAEKLEKRVYKNVKVKISRNEIKEALKKLN